jgi:hypothetical protein
LGTRQLEEARYDFGIVWKRQINQEGKKWNVNMKLYLKIDDGLEHPCS